MNEDTSEVFPDFGKFVPQRGMASWQVGVKDCGLADLVTFQFAGQGTS
jgi:hypothetical protein